MVAQVWKFSAAPEGVEWPGAHPYCAVTCSHANFAVDPVIDVKSEIDGVVELDGRDLGVDEEQGVSGFVVLGKKNAEHYWYPNQSSALIGDDFRNFKRHAKCETGGLFGLP